jgi:hypothetical protein
MVQGRGKATDELEAFRHAAGVIKTCGRCHFDKAIQRLRDHAAIT